MADAWFFIFSFKWAALLLNFSIVAGYNLQILFLL